MTSFQKVSFFFSRLSLGCLFFYAGLTKLLDASWSAQGYLNSAKTFAGFYHWLATPDLLPWINTLNKWGLLLIGISLIVGAFVRLSSFFGAAIMVLYYLPALQFPYPNSHAYIVDEHVIYFFVLMLFIAFNVGRIAGFDRYLKKVRFVGKFV